MAEKEYQRLTPGRRNPNPAVFGTSSSSLWLGKDHLLVVESNGYSERYKRFYFKDIQALAICKTRTGLIRWIVLGVIALFFAVSALAMWDEVVGLCIMGGLALLLAIIAVCDAVPGPTASCSLRTAVHVERLPSLNRVRRARKVLERLKLPIAAAQGTMAPEEIALQMQTRPAFAPAPVNAATFAPPPAAEGEIPPKIVP